MEYHAYVMFFFLMKGITIQFTIIVMHVAQESGERRLMV